MAASVADAGMFLASQQPSAAPTANQLWLGWSSDVGSDAERSSTTMILSSASESKVFASSYDAFMHLSFVGSSGHMMSSDSASPYRSPLDHCSLEEAEEVISMYLNDHHKPGSTTTTPGVNTIDDFQTFRIVNKLEDFQSSRKDLCCELLPTPPRSPDRTDSSSSGSDGEGPATTSVRGSGPAGGVIHDYCGGVDFNDVSLGEAFSCFEMDEVDASEMADLTSEVSTSPEEAEVILNILAKHEDFLDQLLNDESVFSSAPVGDGASTEDYVEDLDVEFLDPSGRSWLDFSSLHRDSWLDSSLLHRGSWVESSYSLHRGPRVDSSSLHRAWSGSRTPEPQPIFYDEPSRQLLHDCMWSGQCADDCKQKAAREKGSASSSLLACSPFEDLVISPASAMTPTSPDDVLDMRIPLTPPVTRGTGSTTLAAVSPATTSTSKMTSVTSSSVRTAAAAVADDALVAGQCVDPSSVLSYTPLSDHSYHQATSSAPPTPPDSPKAVSQQSSSTPSSTSRGAGNGSAGVGQLTLYRSHNGNWQRGAMVMSDTPSESGTHPLYYIRLLLPAED
ncbi:hypothetical protein HPB52_000448 [Rhipicephalus sanguineus]|uniref:Uncharacterized protein n=1 Tax=Rhipicephalus sanguineus TaxID=34632 RepID=A0A9D4T4K1_RHISA|nr:hypothetical protein HPB52_000448 [Rhipicephalus sanguineus]